MKLAPSKFRTAHLQTRLAVLRESLGSERGRPCVRCDVRCSCPERSRSCACMCTASCELAPQMLSSDQDYPVEAGAVSLSYELNATGFVETCWSCEGHTDARGLLCRLPRVWFYSPSGVGVDLVAAHAQALNDRHILNHPWLVQALGTMQLDCPVFALEPSLRLEEETGPPQPAERNWAPLAALHQDMQRLSASLGQRVRAEASSQLQQLRKALANE